jgi:serine phosphatase RsbU (regulator of sigma subunit)
MVLLLTDGITESCNSEDVEFGASRAVTYAHNHSQECAHDIAEGICRAPRSLPVISRSGMISWPS